VIVLHTDHAGCVLVGRADGVGIHVLDLLNQVLGGLLGHFVTLLRVQVHVVGPDGERIVSEIAGVLRSDCKIDTDLMVLESHQRQEETWVPVEPEHQGQVHVARRRDGVCWGWARGQLAVILLLGIIQKDLGIQTEPGLVVLIDGLAADKELNGCESTLSDPGHIGHAIVCRQVRRVCGSWLKDDKHITDQVA